MTDTDRSVLRSIQRNPGSRAVEVAERLDLEIGDVRKSLRRLKTHKRVRWTGNTRGVKYRPA